MNYKGCLKRRLGASDIAALVLVGIAENIVMP